MSARANETFGPHAHVAPAPGAVTGVARARRAAASALAVLAVAGPVAGCASASSGSAAAPEAAASRTPAGTSAGPAGTGSTPGSASSSCSHPSGTGPAAPASGPAPALAAVQFTDSDHGWVAGAGRIMVTSDGGGSWTRQYAGSAHLDQVDFIDGEHGWAAGGDALLRTVDGGGTWTPLAEPCQGELSAVHFVSPAVGYAVAAPATATAGNLPPGGSYTQALGGTLLRTADSGATWSPVTSAPANAQSACFANADDGYLGTPGRIWRTTDGGRHWTLALTEPAAPGNPTTADTPEIECAGTSGLWVLFLGQGAATGHAPYLAYASQDGSQWHGVLEEQFTESALRPGVKLPEGPGSYPGPFSAIDTATAVFIGYTPPLGYGAAPVMLATNNGYALSKEGDVGAINEPMAAAFLSQNRGWVVGENLKTNAFSVEATSNAGRSWTTQYAVG